MRQEKAKKKKGHLQAPDAQTRERTGEPSGQVGMAAIYKLSVK